MDNQLNSLTSNPEKHLSKTQKFVENTKRAVRKVLTSTWIAASTMGPMATTTTATFVPASVNTITAVAPAASTVAKVITLWTAASLMAACGDDGPDSPIETRDTTPPTINVSKSEVDITWWKEICISGNQLYIWDVLVASWSDNKTKNCNVSLSINWKAVTSWTKVSEEWTLTIKVSDEAWNVKNSSITLSVDKPIMWLESIKYLPLQVDQEVDLLQWVTLGNGASLQKVEIEMDGQKSEISDPHHYIPAYPWVCSIILTVKDRNGKVSEYKVDNLTIKALEYEAVSITNVNPEDLMPKVEIWDKNVYKHIEHLRIPEATVVTDMMWKYGAGNHSPEEYQQLMMRLNTGMMWENPVDYNNYEAVWWNLYNEPSNHAHAERFTLNTLVKHANFKVLDCGDYYDNLYNLCKSNPNQINIMWISVGNDVNKEKYDLRANEKIKQYAKEKNRLVFYAWWNVSTEDGNLYNKVYQEDLPLPDEHSVYSGPSRTHNKNDNTLNRHIMVTFWTDSGGNIDQTNENGESSKFPVWFHDKVLFSWRAFPRRRYNWDEISWETWKYATSHTNFVNVAIACILFQMKADTPDVDEFLNMVRATALSTDYIRFDLNGDGDTNDNYNGQPESQPLQLMNPAWFFKKYLMPTNLPSTLQFSKTAALNKWYYKGVIFDIPWAEVKINWQWVAYNDANKSQIKGQNPMNLEWRINGDLCRKMWYKWKSVSWKIIVVDDKWNGLNIDKDFSISIQ